MACPYINATASAAVEQSENVVHVEQEMANSEPLNYTSYLRIDVLLSALRRLSHTDPADPNSPPVHDEHFFILLHQAFELFFKQILFDITSIRDIFENEVDIANSVFNIKLRLERCVALWKMTLDLLDLLQQMTPIEFLEFRDYITPASGFQSLQFRKIELLLGLTDDFRHGFRENYFTDTMFKGDQSEELRSTIRQNSLLFVIEKWLEKLYDQIGGERKFREVYNTAVQKFIEHQKNEKIANGTDADTAGRQAESSRSFFQTMINEENYNELVEAKQRRISHKAMLSALMISLYHQEPCFQSYYEILRSLMDIDGLMTLWRQKHVILVQRQIGRKPGTGGTGGYEYLAHTLTTKYQIFIDLYNISTYLIPQRFLPKLEGLQQRQNLPVSERAFGRQPTVPVVIRTRPTSNESRRRINHETIIVFVLGSFCSWILFFWLRWSRH